MSTTDEILQYSRLIIDGEGAVCERFRANNPHSGILPVWRAPPPPPLTTNTIKILTNDDTRKPYSRLMFFMHFLMISDLRELSIDYHPWENEHMIGWSSLNPNTESQATTSKSRCRAKLFLRKGNFHRTRTSRTIKTEDGLQVKRFETGKMKEATHLCRKKRENAAD